MYLPFFSFYEVNSTLFIFCKPFSFRFVFSLRKLLELFNLNLSMCWDLPLIWVREAAKKKSFFRGQSTKAFSPPPLLGLDVKKRLQKNQKKKYFLVDNPLPAPPLSGQSSKKNFWWGSAIVVTGCYRDHYENAVKTVKFRLKTFLSSTVEPGTKIVKYFFFNLKNYLRDVYNFKVTIYVYKIK